MGLKFVKLFSHLPGDSYSNQYFEDYLDTTDEWIKARTGISKRYFYEGTIEEMMREYCRKISKEQISRIKAVMVASCTSKHQIPSLASIVVGELGLEENILALDINQACSGYLAGLEMLESYLLPGEQALMIGAEKFSDTLNFSDRSTAVLFGDGIGGALIQKTIEKSIYKSYTRANDKVLHYANETEGISMEGKDIYRFVTKDVVNSLENFMEENQIDRKEVTFISHQANGRILDALSKKLKVNPSQIPSNIEYTGNVSSASIPILLEELKRDKKLKRGDKIVFMAFGAGLSWSFGYTTW